MAFENVQQTTADERRKLLEAVATAGSAGKAAYEQARQGINQANQASAARALQAAIQNGVDPSAAPGSVRAAAENALAQRQAGLSQAEGTFNADLARRQAAMETYLSGVNAAVPAVQASADTAYKTKKADLETNLATRQSDLDRALALAQQSYEQKQKEQAAQQAWEQEKMNFERQKMAASLAPKMPTTQQLLGAANQAQTAATARAQGGPVPFKDYNGSTNPADVSAHLREMEAQAAQRRLDNQTAGAPLQDLAFQIGQSLGVNPAQLAELYSPSTLASLATAQKKIQPPPSPEESFLTTIPGIDSKTAKTIAADSEYKAANDNADYFLTASLDSDGAINDGSEYSGMTPWQAYSRWLSGNVAPKKSRTLAALQKYYKPLLDARSAK